MEPCGSCKSSPAQVRWLRRFPGIDRLGLCTPCGDRISKKADDRAHDDADEMRLIQMAQWLAGEVWSSPDSTFWFREPILLRLDATPGATFSPSLDLGKLRRT